MNYRKALTAALLLPLVLAACLFTPGKFESALEKGFGFCDVVLGWDSNDQLYDNTKLTGWHTAYPDAAVRVLPETMRLIPFENDLPFFLAEFDGYAEAA